MISDSNSLGREVYLECLIDENINIIVVLLKKDFLYRDGCCWRVRMLAQQIVLFCKLDNRLYDFIFTGHDVSLCQNK